MTFAAKELSADQRSVIEGLLGRTLGEEETVLIRAAATEAAPQWLRRSLESARALGVEGLSIEEIDAEIYAARQSRRALHPSPNLPSAHSVAG